VNWSYAKNAIEGLRCPIAITPNASKGSELITLRMAFAGQVEPTHAPQRSPYAGSAAPVDHTHRTRPGPCRRPNESSCGEGGRRSKPNAPDTKVYGDTASAAGAGPLFQPIKHEVIDRMARPIWLLPSAARFVRFCRPRSAIGLDLRLGRHERLRHPAAFSNAIWMGAQLCVASSGAFLDRHRCR